MAPAARPSRFSPVARLLAVTVLCLALPATQVAAETTASFFLWANDVDQKLEGGTRLETEESFTDATLDVRGHYAYTPYGGSPFMLDVDTGSTEPALHAVTGIEYAWGASSGTAAYRHMTWRVDDHDYHEPVIYEGPLLAFRYRF